MKNSAHAAAAPIEFTLPETGEAMITVQQFAAASGLSVTTIWTRIRENAPNFPQPVRDGPMYTRFRLSDVRTYLAALSAGVPKVTPPMLARSGPTVLGMGAPR